MVVCLQACRGDQSDSGAEIMSRAVTMTDGPSGPKMSYVIPTTADILVAHATYEGKQQKLYIGCSKKFVPCQLSLRCISNYFN